MSAFRSALLDGKVADVAGGTCGMNLAIAKRYAAHGASVCVVSRSPERCAAAQADRLFTPGTISTVNRSRNRTTRYMKDP